MQDQIQIAKRRVAFFTGLLLIFTLAASLLAARIQALPISSLFMMWTPALAAFVASLVTHRPFREIGWSLRPVKWLALAWFIPILYGFIAYVPLWLTGLGAVPNPTFLERARLTLNLTTGSDTSVIFAAFGFITVVNLLPSMFFSLGEEIGWRGFLVPELSKWMSIRKAGLLSGLIWSFWHLPGILGADYHAEGTPLAYQLACFFLMVISGGMIFAWVRMKSGNVWSAVILHAVHNNVIQAFFDRITTDTGYTRYFVGEFGLALSLATLILAIVVWRKLGEQEITKKEILESA